MSFFDESYYLQAKLKQLTATGEKDANGNAFTMNTLKAAIADAGMSAEQHYKAYGQAENLNPNPYFNEAEYLSAKLAQLTSTGEKDANGQPFTLATLKAAIDATGMTAAEHYEVYGSKETTADGHLINPSNAFDANAYVAAKLLQLQSAGNANAEERAQWAGKTVVELVEALKEAGLSPVTHYESYGANEAAATKTPLVQTVPSEQRVANDPVREQFNEIVPTNYNPATPAPEKAVAAAPAKPADVAQKVPAAVSPAPIIPEKSAPVPGDSGYVNPPSNIKDTAANPVIPPSSSDSNTASGNWMVVNPDKGTATIVGQDGSIKGDVKVEISTGGGAGGGSTVVIPPAEDKPVTELPPTTTLPPSVTVKPDDPGNVDPGLKPDNPGGGTETPDDTPSDTTAPTFVSAATNTDGSKIILTYDEDLSTITAEAKCFTLGGTSAKVASVAVDGKTVVLTLTGNIYKYDKPTIKYDDPTSANDTNAVQDTSGNDAASLPATSFTNTSTKVPTFAVTETDPVADAWTIGSGNGAVTVTIESSKFVFTPAEGTKVEVPTTDIKKLIVPDGTELKGLYATLNTLTVIDGKVTLTDAAIAATDANTLALKTTGAVTAKLTDAALSTLNSALTDATPAGGNAYTIKITDTSGVTAADLITLDGKTSVAIDASSVTSITGKSADLTKLYVTDKAGFTGFGNETITLSDGAYNASTNNVTIKASDLSAIGAATTGVVTVDNAVRIAGTLAEMTAALVTADSRVVAATANVNITSDITTAEQRTALKAIDDVSQTDTLTLRGVDTGANYDLTGYATALRIFGGSGADTINGGDGADYINGGAGNDIIAGGKGADYIVGGYVTPVDAGAGITDTDTIFAGAVSVIENGVYKESVKDAVSGYNTTFLQAMNGNNITNDAEYDAPNWLTQKALDLVNNATIIEGRYGADTLVASTQKDVFFYQVGGITTGDIKGLKCSDTGGDTIHAFNLDSGDGKAVDALFILDQSAPKLSGGSGDRDFSAGWTFGTDTASDAQTITSIVTRSSGSATQTLASTATVTLKWGGTSSAIDYTKATITIDDTVFPDEQGGDTTDLVINLVGIQGGSISTKLGDFFGLTNQGANLTA